MPSLFLMMDGGNLEHAMCGISVDISGVVWVVFKCDKTSLRVGCCLPSPVRVTMIDDLGTVNGLVRVSNELCLHTPMCTYVQVFVCMHACLCASCKCACGHTCIVCVCVDFDVCKMFV